MKKTSYEIALEQIAFLKTQEALSFEEAVEVLTFEDSYSRLMAIWSLRWKMQHNEWLKLLGKYWSTCDNISAGRTALKSVMGTNGPLNEMMHDEERVVYNALPEVVTIYRGCGKRNMIGASWTTDRSIAEKFPFLNRYRAKEPLLVTATVNKKHILAVKLGRNEQEIITFSAKRISVEPLTAPEGR